VKTAAIEPARVDFDRTPGAPPWSPTYGDVYHPQVGALEQARHVFLGGNGLPARWAGRDRFVILETGFGLGHNFLAAWDAWRRDDARCASLHFVSLERHPVRRSDLERAHAGSALADLAAALLEAWPALTPNLHSLDFEGGRVQLLLALGDVATVLPALRLQADAFFLDGFAPARNPQMWQPRVLKALGRKAAPAATLATWSVAAELRHGLVSAGFEVERRPGIGGKREISVARWSPRHSRPVWADGARPAARSAVVVGAGIAGASVALALARLGLAVTVLEARAAPALGASGNPAGLFHGTLHGDDGIYPRLFRAAALQAQRDYAEALARGAVRGSAAGLLRLHDRPGEGLAQQALLQRQGLPADYVQALTAEAASILAGLPLPAPAWYYPGGGWLAPAEWVRHALASPGVQLLVGRQAASLAEAGADWQVRDARGALLAAAPLLVLANAGAAAGLLATVGMGGWPTTHSRGQVSHWPGPSASALKRPVAGAGYALPLPGGGVLCGATRAPGLPPEAGGAEEELPRLADHQLNVERLRRLVGLEAPDPSQWQGRVGWRLEADDRLPIAGPVPLADLDGASRLDQARLLARASGLFVLTALGSRGLTLAPLLGRLVAAQATGSPWPLEQDLADAVDPGRWIVRAARAAAGRGVASKP
jgi:tRNA 5-methylaminomethyl-2-thiouridine biosynthesis bifunctional protein